MNIRKGRRTILSVDFGKTIFQLAALNQLGEVVVRKKFSRAQLLRFTATRQIQLIAMEHAGSHFLLLNHSNSRDVAHSIHIRDNGTQKMESAGA